MSPPAEKDLMDAATPIMSPPTEKDLIDSARSGDVAVLQSCVDANKSNNFYLHLSAEGNFLHIAVKNNRKDFISQAIQKLDAAYIQNVLFQSRDPKVQWNPLHEAAFLGNVEITRMLLHVYKPPLPTPDKRPWLMRSAGGNLPCYVAMHAGYEKSAREIIQFDLELIDKPSNRGASLLYEALLECMSKLAWEILQHPRCSTKGEKGFTALHAVSRLEGSEKSKDICQNLLQKGLETAYSDIRKDSALHSWARDGKSWPFECFESNISKLSREQRKTFVEMISHQNTQGNTPLHILASSVSNEDDGIKIAKILMCTYKEEGSQSSSSTPPWRKQNEVERTPLSIAISRKFQEFAKHILEEDKFSVDGTINVLSLAIENKCHEVAVKILDIVYPQPQTDQLLTNVLHLAPLCTGDIYTKLFGTYPELIDEVDSEGNTILHSWMSRANCETQLVHSILNSPQRSSFIKLIYSRNYNSQNNPIHVAATNSKDTTPVVKLLVEAFRKEYSLKEDIINYIPWFRENKAGQGALQLAISQGNVTLASYILSLRQDESYHSLLDYYRPRHSTLFLAIQNSCFQAAKQILEGLLKFKKKQISEGLDQNIWTKYLTNPSDGQNILHLAADLTDEVFGTYLVNQVPELSIVHDSSGKSPVDKAFEVGCTWFIEALLKKDSSMFQRNRESVPWANACANGHVSTLKAYINHDEEAFRDLCIVLKDSPLHYIRLPLKKYKEFFEDEFMQNFINLQNSEGQTPLHLAISKGDKILTEMLLNMNQIDYQIKDAKGESPIASLAKKYDEAEDNEAWKRLCYRTGIDPHVNMTYFHKGTDSAHVRSSLFVVAALFATITFPAGFTLPGGLDSMGNPVLGGNFAFLASLFSNALAFICSMLALNILTWSMVTPYRRSELKLIDFSMVLLITAFSLTTMAFGFGVSGVLAPKSLLPALLIALLMILLVILLLAPALHIWVKSSGISSLCSGSLASTLRCFAKKENPCDNEELNAGELRMQDELQPSS